MTCHVLKWTGALLVALSLSPWCAIARADVVTFEDLGLPASSYENGASLSGGFVSSGTHFNNKYDVDPTYGASWLGWSYSSMTDTVTPDYSNQFSAITGSGADASQTYGVAFYGLDYYGGFVTYYPTITIPDGKTVESAQVTNTAYAYHTMVSGGYKHPAFDATDWLKLTVTGLDAADQSIGTEDFFLAENGNIVSDWTTFDLSSLSDARKLQFELTSTRNDATWGILTPAYFALDNLVLADVSPPPVGVPEPVGGVLLLSGLATLVLLRRRLRGTR